MRLLGRVGLIQALGRYQTTTPAFSLSSLRRQAPSLSCQASSLTVEAICLSREAPSLVVEATCFSREVPEPDP
jgi:hypothetical protein